jgi:hypothetical protein
VYTLSKRVISSKRKKDRKSRINSTKKREKSEEKEERARGEERWGAFGLGKRANKNYGSIGA